MSQHYLQKGSSAASSTPLLSDASDTGDTTFGTNASMRSSEEKSDQPLSPQRDTNSGIPGGMTVNQSFQMVIGSPPGPLSGTDPLAGRPMKSPPTQIPRRGNAVQPSPLTNFRATRPQTLREDEELVDMNGDIHVNRYYNQTRNANLSIASSKFSELSVQPIHPNGGHTDDMSVYSLMSNEQSQQSNGGHTLRTGSFDTQQSQISWDEPTERGSFATECTDLILPTDDIQDIDEPTPQQQPSPKTTLV